MLQLIPNNVNFLNTSIQNTTEKDNLSSSTEQKGFLHL